MMKRVAFLFLLIAIILSACGTLEVSMEGTHTPAPTVTRTPAPTVTPTATATPASLLRYGEVNALAVQPDGKIVVGGAFTKLNGEPRFNIARLNPDGTLDPEFNPGANHTVRALALQPDGKIVVGGSFFELGGEPRYGLGRLNPDGTLDLSFNPWADNRNIWINALTLQRDGKILVGGDVGSAGKLIMRLYSDGTLDTTFKTNTALMRAPNVIRYSDSTINAVLSAGANGLGSVESVEALVLQSDGKIVVGGYFSELGGELQVGLGRLNRNGTLDATFFPSVGDGVRILAMQQDGKILVGSSYGYRGIARLYTDGECDFAFDPAETLGVEVLKPNALALQPNGKILISAWADSSDGDTRYIFVRLNPDGTLDARFTPLNLLTNDRSYPFGALALQPDGKIVVGGSVYADDEEAGPYLARLNPDGTLDTTFKP